MKVYVSIYLCIDSHGNKYSATCEESSDTIQICGMKDKKGENVYFETEAYHLEGWCDMHGINLKRIEQEYDFDALWNNN